MVMAVRRRGQAATARPEVAAAKASEEVAKVGRLAVAVVAVVATALG